MQAPLDSVGVGMMSGTSLDGIDLVAVRFTKYDAWHFEILASSNIQYTSDLSSKLSKAKDLKLEELAALGVELGQFYGAICSKFILENEIKADFVGNHGQTILHRPGKGYSMQLGNAAHLAAAVNLPVVADFRNMDMAFGGQGAPLVPLGDELLFPEYKFCLNLGGICNISTNLDGKRIGYDVDFCNLMLNKMANKMGFPFDQDGLIARSGIVMKGLLERLEKFNFLQNDFPKSLDETDMQYYIDTVNENGFKVEDILATVVENIALNVSKSINSLNGTRGDKILLSGGGGHNLFLVERINANTHCEIEVPPNVIIDQKEALIFAFLGLLRMLGVENSLASVTGASKNTIGGCIYLPA